VRVGFSCMLWSPRPFGVGRSILSLANALIETREDDELVMYVPPGLPLESLASGARPHGVRVVRAPAWTSSRAGRIFWEQAQLPRDGARDGLDLLMAPGYVLPARMRVPVVLLVHDLIALERPELCRLMNRWHYALALPASVRRAAAVVTFSERVRRQVAERFGSSAPPTSVVLPGIDESFFRSVTEAELERVRNAYGLPRRFVLFAGDVEPKKNLARLIDAQRLARSRGVVDGPVVVTRGSTLASDELVLPLRFVPNQDLCALFHSARLLAFPSLVEGFGLPVVEAMAASLPVLSSLVPAVEHTSSEAVVLADPTDVESIALGLARLWQDDELRRVLCARGREAARPFHWTATARALWRLYADVVR